MDPSYNSPLLRRASAARAPSTGSFYDVTDHIATLTTNDLLCRLTHTGHGTALKFHRSAQLSRLSPPFAHALAPCILFWTAARRRTVRVRRCPWICQAPSGTAAGGTPVLSRLMRASGRFSREPIPPLFLDFTGNAESLTFTFGQVSL